MDGYPFRSMGETWFSRGVNWMYAFNHEEAQSCFRKAAKASEQHSLSMLLCVHCMGSNYNNTWDSFSDLERSGVCASAMQILDELEERKTTTLEGALLAAMKTRFTLVDGDFQTSTEAFAQQMLALYLGTSRGVVKEPGRIMGFAAVPSPLRFDNDVFALLHVLTAEALMMTRPWNLWDLSSGQPTHKDTLVLVDILEKGLGLFPENVGLLHMYIHAMEMSPHPEAALKAADALQVCSPGAAGHLLHMSSHIYSLCGLWHHACLSNQHAVQADELWVQHRGFSGFYSLYRAHNAHFLAYAAMFLGRYHMARQAVATLEKALPTSCIREVGADWLEAFHSIQFHVLIRFGKWDEIVAVDSYEDSKLYAVSSAMRRYARGVALAAVGKPEEARREQRLFLDACEQCPQSRTLFNYTVTEHIFPIAKKMLEGEILYREQRYQECFRTLREAVTLEESLPYDEPWGWMVPVRHALGALLLEQGHRQLAANVYLEDLGLSAEAEAEKCRRSAMHPNNVWALVGLANTGVKQPAHVSFATQIALARSDPVQCSCFCATTQCCNKE